MEMKTTLNSVYLAEGDPRGVFIDTGRKGDMYGAARRISTRGSTRLPQKRGICRVFAAILARRA